MRLPSLLFFIHFLLTTSIFSQTQYPKGCYMSLEEIKSKTPSEDFEIKIARRTNGDIKMSGGNDYKLESPDKSIKKKFLKKEIWAVSDGKYLYINCLLQGCQLWYAVVESDENELIFRGGISSSEATSAAVMGGAIGGAIGGAATATKRYKYSLNLNSGKMKRID